jgi:hypothetical protein
MRIESRAKVRVDEVDAYGFGFDQDGVGPHLRDGTLGHGQDLRTAQGGNFDGAHGSAPLYGFASTSVPTS